MFHSPTCTLNCHLPDISSLQTTDHVRLQRLQQQRQRMEHMTVLIQQQTQTIQILQHENSSISQQFHQLQLQTQLLNDKLTLATHHSQDLTELLVKQVAIIENLRACLFGGHPITEYQQNLLDQEIQTSLTLFHSIQAGKAKLHMASYNSQLSQLAQQNQLLNQKYQNLCADYLELNKTLKVKEYELLKFENPRHTGTIKNAKQNHQSQRNNSNNSNDSEEKDASPHKGQKTSNNKHNSKSNNQLENLLKIKQLEIVQFKKITQKLQEDVRRRDELIKEHRKNQKEQKKLVHHLRVKFNEEGNLISQIAKSKHIIEVTPATKSETYEIQNPVMKSSVRKVQAMTPQVVETKVFEQRSQNLMANTAQSFMKNSSLLKVMSKRDSSKQKMKDSLFKKTVSKCMIEN